MVPIDWLFSVVIANGWEVFNTFYSYIKLPRHCLSSFQARNFSMASFQKVVWYEGMNLDPHHMQQWERYNQSNLNFLARSISFFQWGLLELSINKDALNNGQFQLIRCKGIMPDGLFFNMPDSDVLPHFRSVKESMTATQDKLYVYLLVPAEREGEKNVSLEESAPSQKTRYRTKNLKIADENTGADERTISVAQTNFEIRFDNEDMENYVSLQIAEIVRTPDGGFDLNPDFIPPALSVSSSKRMLDIINGLLEHLVSRRSALYDVARRLSSGQFSGNDLAKYMQLFTINNCIPILNHFFTSQHVHPETLYINMLSLAGQLITISPEEELHPRDLPKYDHSNLSICFNRLDEIIAKLLKRVVVSKNYFQIPLSQQEDTLFIGKIDNPQLLAEADFFLSCVGDFPGRNLVNEIPRNVKIAARQEMSNLDKYALPGLPISSITRPPVEMPVRDDLFYFKLEKAGQLWTGIVNTQEIAIRISRIFVGIKLELLAYKPKY